MEQLESFTASPRLSLAYTWDDHISSVKEVIQDALYLLRKEIAAIKPTIWSHEEDDISFILHDCLKEANAKLRKGGRGVPHYFIYQGQNQPSPGDRSRDRHLKKRPDFLWGMLDDTQTDVRRSQRFYCIECKRLGKYLRADRIYNQFYVENGVARFVLEEWGYAKSEQEATMIAYVHSMEFDDILNEVNVAATTFNVAATTVGIAPLPAPSGGWVDKGLSIMVQPLVRCWAPFPFELHHFWIDLRDCYRDEPKPRALRSSRATTKPT